MESPRTKQLSYSHELISSDYHETIADGDDTAVLSPKHIGIPSKKPTIRFIDVLVLVISVCCYTIAVLALKIRHVAWFLGYQYQIVVLGLMLSLMNACLTYSRPFSFILLEARFGRSTLHNYEEILTNSIYGSRTDIHWRLLLLLAWLLPIALSVGYKLFPPGINYASVVYDSSVDFGFYPPIGLQKPTTGVALMANLSLPLMEGTTAPDGYDADPSGPIVFGPYGLNTLLLSEVASAALDLPSADFVADVRQRLRTGETWQVKAEVLGTIARQNLTVDKYRDMNLDESQDFWNYYWNQVHQPVVTPFQGDDTKIVMMNNQGANDTNDSSWLFLSFGAAGIEDDKSINSSALMFTITREPCSGEWNITRTTMQLVRGHCNGSVTDLPLDHQDVFTNNRLGLHGLFLSSIHESLGKFTSSRSGSLWHVPVATAVVANMLYSRVAAWTRVGPRPTGLPGRTYPAQGQGIRVKSMRPGLEASPGLLILLAVPLLLLALSMLTTLLLHKVPLDRKFGLTAILAGVERDALQVLKAAGLSDESRRTVGLGVTVTRGPGDVADVRYTVTLQSS